jgi:hypothetical protein
MGLADWFTDFCSNLQVKNSYTISTRYKSITRRLNTDFWSTTSETSHSLYVGSYGRNTAISGFSDVDIVFELPSNLYWQYDAYTGNGQSALLQNVRNSIIKTYPNTSVGADGQVIVVSFNDNTVFEVVPVFVNEAGTYTYPDSNNGGSWKTTDPKAEIDAIRQRNSYCGNNLVPLCRMMRAWKNKWSVPISGLLIDTLSYQFINDWEYKDKSYFYYDYLSRDFFKWMSEQDQDKSYWKAPGSGQYVYYKDLFQYKAQRCYNISLLAIEYETDTPKLEYSAKQKWREIYGTSFPD